MKPPYEHTELLTDARINTPRYSRSPISLRINIWTVANIRLSNTDIGNLILENWLILYSFCKGKKVIRRKRTKNVHIRREAVTMLKVTKNKYFKSVS